MTGSFLSFEHMCVGGRGCAHEFGCPQRSEGGIHPLELELHTSSCVSHPVWVLRTKLTIEPPVSSNCIPEWLQHFMLPLCLYQSCLSLVLHFNQPSRCVMVCHRGFKLQLLMANGPEKLLMCLSVHSFQEKQQPISTKRCSLKRSQFPSVMR